MQRRWAQQCSRGEEIRHERSSGWHFPILTTEAHRESFQIWLATRYLRLSELEKV